MITDKKIKTAAGNALHFPAVMLTALAIAALAGCSGRGNENRTAKEDSATVDDFHADDDIAMTVKSIADAIRVGEPLDTVEYNYECVFTDGQGRPLYTNLHGQPGKWNVDAVSTNYLTIRNTDLGDLLTDDLESYLTANLGLGQESRVDSLSHDEGSHHINVYDFGGGQMHFDVHLTTTPTGIEAPIVIISLSSN